MKQLIKKILKEEVSGKSKLEKMIKSYGLEIAGKAVGGIDNLLRILNINTPMDFLHLFDDLDVLQSEEKPDWTLFRYKPKQNLMIYNRKNKDVYIGYYEIWSVLENHFGLNNTEIQVLTEMWLGEVYNLGGITTPFNLLTWWLGIVG